MTHALIERVKIVLIKSHIIGWFYFSHAKLKTGI